MVSAVGLGLYLGAIALNVNRFVVPVPPLGHWWTIPVLLLGALQNGALEEVGPWWGAISTGWNSFGGRVCGRWPPAPC